MYYFYSLILIFLTGFAFGQDEKTALKYFNSGDYEQAIEELEEILKADSSDEVARYFLGVSFLNSNIDKSLATEHFEYLTSQKNCKADSWYLLGRAYHYGYRFDKAMECFQKFIETGEGSADNKKDVVKQIEYCENAKELMKFPLNVSFQNLGKEVNSKYADYFPFIPGSEAYIMYNSRRYQSPDQMEDGSFSPKIFISFVKDGKFDQSQMLPAKINDSEGAQEIVGLNSSGSKAMFYLEDFKGNGNLYSSNVEGFTFTEPVKESKSVNSKYKEISACLTESGRKIYFASDRPGGYGGTDLYICQKLPNGEWSVPRNLGPTINTAYDEDFPNISSDGKTLYFSSKGHTSMGGYDIFKATYDQTKRKFSGIQNIGYPINTPEDNMNFRASNNGRYGYVSAVRKEGYGDLDIYRVTFHDVEPRYTVITGTIKGDDGKEDFEDLFIQVTDQETDEIYGDYYPSERTKRYVIILPPGKFNIMVGAYGYEEIYEEMEIMGKTSFKSFVNKDIILKVQN